MTEEEGNYLEEVEPGDEIFCAASFGTRTGSPVVFVVTEVMDDTPLLAWVSTEKE